MENFLIAGIENKVLITLCFGAIIFLVGIFLTFYKFRNSAGSPRQPDTANHHSYNNDLCPICLGTHKLPVETNCGHKFCGLCLKNYLNRTSGDFTLFRSRISCPLCRQDINILLLNFSLEEIQSEELEEERRNVERAVHLYNIHFGGGPHNLLSYIRDCPVLIRHMFFDFFTFEGLVSMFRFRVLLCCLGAIVYIFNPWDIIPEVFGVFGFLDDVIVFLLCVIYVSIIYRRLIISRAVNTS